MRVDPVGYRSRARALARRGPTLACWAFRAATTLGEAGRLGSAAIPAMRASQAPCRVFRSAEGLGELGEAFRSFHSFGRARGISWTWGAAFWASGTLARAAITSASRQPG